MEDYFRRRQHRRFVKPGGAVGRGKEVSAFVQTHYASELHSGIVDVDFEELVVLCRHQFERGRIRRRGNTVCGIIGVDVVIGRSVGVESVTADVCERHLGNFAVGIGFRTRIQPGYLAVDVVFFVEVSVYVADIGSADDLRGLYTVDVGFILVVGNDDVGIYDIGIYPFVYHLCGRRIFCVERFAVVVIQYGIRAKHRRVGHIVVVAVHRAHFGG